MKPQTGHDRTSDPRVKIPRRTFLKSGTVAAAAVVAGGLGSLAPRVLSAADAPAPAVSGGKSSPESLVKILYDSLSPKQKEVICFDWDYVEKVNGYNPGEPARGLLRTYISSDWRITRPNLIDDFYNKEQAHLIREIYEGMISPEWVKRIDQQLLDDAGGYGRDQTIGIFGKPGTGRFEFVMTGLHMTMRCDGNSTEHAAFGGPIFYGHAAQAYNEAADHPGNVFWPQALAANKIYHMFDKHQQEQALVTAPRLPHQNAVGFRAPGEFPGLAVKDMSRDQQAELQKVLKLLVEPYRQSERDRAMAALKKQGGLEKCSLAFYQAGDIGNDKVWDNWRLEGPSFVWYFRGTPHVHVWVNVADDPGVKLNA